MAARPRSSPPSPDMLKATSPPVSHSPAAHRRHVRVLPSGQGGRAGRPGSCLLAVLCNGSMLLPLLSVVCITTLAGLYAVTSFRAMAPGPAMLAAPSGLRLTAASLQSQLDRGQGAVPSAGLPALPERRAPSTFHVVLVQVGPGRLSPAAVQEWRTALAYQQMSFDHIMPGALPALLRTVGDSAVVVRSDARLSWVLLDNVQAAYLARLSGVTVLSGVCLHQRPGATEAPTRLGSPVAGVLLRRGRRADLGLQAVVDAFTTTTPSAARSEREVTAAVPAGWSTPNGGATVLCNARDLESSRRRPPMQTYTPAEAVATSNYTVQCKYRDRLGNNMFQYAFCRLYAEHYGTALHYGGGPRLEAMQRIYPRAVGLANRQADPPPLEYRATRNGYWQNFAHYRGERERVRRWLRPWIDPAKVEVTGPRDIVIHFRDFQHEFKAGRSSKRISVSADYYTRVIPTLRARGFSGRIVVATEPLLIGQSPILEALEAEYRVEYHNHTPAEDLSFLRSAKGALLITLGTFSWWGAWLNSAAREIHVPFTSSCTECRILPWAQLLVDNDPRYVYHNLESLRFNLSAHQVLAARDTPFGKQAAKGRRALDDPLPCLVSHPNKHQAPSYCNWHGGGQAP